ncbi:hypothetical protein [Arthrobacter methylotrophus]|uniref:hypothetical protein n=1 Tax=Arthrobacter methylotrophus TaxID=121291 RepID=UPI0031E9EA2E
MAPTWSQSGSIGQLRGCRSLSLFSRIGVCSLGLLSTQRIDLLRVVFRRCLRGERNREQVGRFGQCRVVGGDRLDDPDRFAADTRLGAADACSEALVESLLGLADVVDVRLAGGAQLSFDVVQGAVELVDLRPESGADDLLGFELGTDSGANALFCLKTGTQFGDGPCCIFRNGGYCCGGTDIGEESLASSAAK